MALPKRTVWVVMHYEYIGLPECPHVDALQFHVSSSKRKAEAYIRRVIVDAHSWWQLHPHGIDSQDYLMEGDEVYYYSYRGAHLRSAPHKRALTAFQKHVDRNPEFYRS
jgi:hypothetical protein